MAEEESYFLSFLIEPLKDIFVTLGMEETSAKKRAATVVYIVILAITAVIAFKGYKWYKGR